MAMLRERLFTGADPRQIHRRAAREVRRALDLGVKAVGIRDVSDEIESDGRGILVFYETMIDEAVN